MNLREKLITILQSTQNEIKRMIADCLINDFTNNKFSSINEIAEKCFLSKSTITKFSIKLGFSGYRELVTRLKYERENYTQILKNNSEVQNYEETKKYFLDFLDFFDQYKEDFLKIKNLLATKTYIIASRQLYEQGRILNFYLKKNNIDVEFSEYAVPNYNVPLSIKDATFIFITGGMEIDSVFRLYDLIKVNNNIIFLTSFALSSRIDKAEVKIVFDKDNFSTNLYSRQAIVSYLITQIINMIT